MIIKIMEMLFVACVFATFTCSFVAAAFMDFDFLLATLSFAVASYVLFLLIEYFAYDNNMFPSCKPKTRRRDR